MIGIDKMNIISTDEQVNMEWKTHKTLCNGSPTYGRRFYAQVATVMKAKSGEWFFFTCVDTDIAEPTGPYKSAEEAKQAYDVLRY